MLAHRQVDQAPPLIYGPIQSRRFGRSLGINLLPPGLRLCHFDCLYCQCDGARRRARLPGDPEFPTLAALEQALVAALAADPDVDDICFAGCGEPTLHPQFREAMLFARSARDSLAPRATITVLSNGVAVSKPAVHGALALADRAVLKLDAARDDLLLDLNGVPEGLTAMRLIAQLARLMQIETQTILVHGAVDNATPDALELLGAALRFIHPRRAQVGTITRAPASAAGLASLQALDPAALEAAVVQLRAHAPGVDICAY
jgi:wyosine [tRNA(Phe)-imidazoG37] synthetase (radical SAM superfamily)